MCSGLADLFTSWFIFIVVICHWPDGLVSEAHIINHGGHYCSVITLSLSEPATYNANTVSCKVCSAQQETAGDGCCVCIVKILHSSFELEKSEFKGYQCAQKMQWSKSLLSTFVESGCVSPVTVAHD